MNNISVHGGEDILSHGSALGNTDSCSTTKNKTKTKIDVHYELNVLDQIVSDGNTNISALKNDIHKNKELTFDVKSPTPVTTGCIRHSNKHGRNIKYDNLTILLDSGCSHSILAKKYASNKLKEKKQTFATGGGDMSTKWESKQYFSLSELSRSKIVDWTFQVTDSKNLGYDMIIGRDIMQSLGINLLFSEQTIQWEGAQVPMRDFNKLKKYNLNKYELNAIIQNINEPIITQEATDRMIRILDSKYEQANLREVVKGATHLNQSQKDKLYQLLLKYEDIFDGTLGEWEGEPVDFETVDGAKPHSQRHYPVPHLYKKTFEKELMRLVELGVLEKVSSSEWGSPTFIVPKKDGRIRFVSDFRQLNTKLKRKPFPLPRIQDTLQNLEGFSYATALDLNMGYYHIKLSAEASDMCTIVTEFGLFKYKRLPMGVSCSPDIFQSKIFNLLGDIEGTKAYIDDILVVKKGSFDEHLEQLDEVFRRCQKAGLKMNAEKCRFGWNEIDYLGYIVTPTGVKPNPKKIKAIKNMQRPRTVTEVRRLIGMVQYYRDLWPRRSHILEPFTAVSSGKKGTKIKWTPELETAFKETIDMVCTETLLNYPDWSKPFDVHTDASDYQLGAVISQEGKPIAFYSRKLNKAQRNYTTTEKELLSIVETVKEFRNILFGYPIRVYSDHKNLVHSATISQSQRVMRWRLILEEFGPDIRHIKGEDNIVADAISRLPTASQDPSENRTESHDLSEAAECLPLENEEGFPLLLSNVRKRQQIELNKNNSKLKQLVNTQKSGYQISTIEGIEIVTYEDKIYVPPSLRNSTINWYHHFLCHPGADRLYKTINRVAYWKGMASQITTYSNRCDTCQRHKKRKRKYGKLPPKNVGDLIPWQTVHVDLIGPYSITAEQLQPDGSYKTTTLELTCMTMIDPATGWFEIVQVPNYNSEKDTQEVIDKTSARISQLFNNTWLARYPRPREVIYDNGSEFKRHFEILLKDFAIKPKCTTIKNPQSNSPIERIHQVLKSMFTTKNLPSQRFDLIDPFGEILSSIAWAVRASYNSTTQATPAQLVFGRDMLFNMKALVNWKALSVRKQQIVDKANLRENRNRIDYDYSVGQQVYIVKDGIFRKLDTPKLGPFAITETYTNGTVRIQRGRVNERINIRRLEPHF